MLDKARNAQRAYILTELTPADLYGQLAEEAAELAQAALKVQRILLGRNPPATTADEAIANLTEELSDVCLLLELMELEPSTEVMDAKTARWYGRLKERDIHGQEQEG